MTYSQPLLPLFLLLSVWSFLRLRRVCGRRGHWLEWSSIVLLFLACWPVTAWLAAESLESRYASASARALPPDVGAIVVLGANAYPSNPSQPEPEPGFSSYLRTTHGAWLFHNWKQVPIVVSGGSVPLGPWERGGPVTLATLMRRELLKSGVPPEMIWTDDRSSSTYENAVDTAAILLPKGIRRIVLVTEGFHMRRAELCFRKQGFDVIPAPCALRTMEIRPGRSLLLPAIWGLRVNEECLHEWVGLAWYRLSGKI